MSRDSNVFPDYNLDKVYAHSDGRIFTLGIPDELRLSFGGRVTTVPSQGSLSIAEFCGVKFYIDTAGYNSLSKAHKRCVILIVHSFLPV